MRCSFVPALGVVVLCVVALPARAADAPASYDAQIRPLLNTYSASATGP